MLTWTDAQREAGFRRVETLFPVHVARRGARPFPLPNSSRTLAVDFRVDDRPLSVEAFMAAQRMSGLLVIQDGRVVLERYGLGRTPRDRWTSFSLAKSVTSILVGAALHEGAITSLDDSVVRYIPELGGGAYDVVTVRQLISMTSGVRWTEDYGDPQSDVVRVGSWTPEHGVDPIVSYMRGLPRVAPPGAKFQYKSGDADLAGVLVARAVGMPLAQYLSKKVWGPFGMGRDAVWITNAEGHDRGGCCISMTLRDAGRLGLFMLGDGVAGGRQVLPPEWAAEATSRQVDAGLGETGYGYLWWTRPDGEFQAAGIYGQMIDVVPSEGLVVVAQSAWPRPTDPALAAARTAFIKAVRTAARRQREGVRRPTQEQD